jgi:hypothetical protein
LIGLMMAWAGYIQPGDGGMSAARQTPVSGRPLRLGNPFNSALADLFPLDRVNRAIPTP